MRVRGFGRAAMWQSTAPARPSGATFRRGLSAHNPPAVTDSHASPGVDPPERRVALPGQRKVPFRRIDCQPLRAEQRVRQRRASQYAGGCCERPCARSSVAGVYTLAPITE